MAREPTHIMGCLPDCYKETFSAPSETVSGYMFVHATGCMHAPQGALPASTVSFSVSSAPRTCRHCGMPDP